jgi:hypothetical protein
MSLRGGFITKSSILVIRGEPVLRLDLLGLNLLLPQRIMVTWTIKIDDVIDVLRGPVETRPSFRHE